MTTTTETTTPTYMDTLDKIIADVIAPAAVEVDQTGAFPRAAFDALGQAGLLGLISATEVGGLGQGHRAATLAVERRGRACGSTAMVLCMHYAGTAVIEAHGPREVREAIAAGRHLTTLAFSEAGSRSHFWAPVSTAHRVPATGRCGSTRRKAGPPRPARPTATSGPAARWPPRAPARSGWCPPTRPACSIPAPFNGLGLRGNNSSPVTAEGVRDARRAPCSAPDGGGFDIMMGVVLPYFQLMNAAGSLGTMEAATDKTAAHAGGTSFEHLGSALADLPTIRAYIARMRIKTDMVRGLLLDTLDALESGPAPTRCCACWRSRPRRARRPPK